MKTLALSALLLSTACAARRPTDTQSSGEPCAAALDPVTQAPHVKAAQDAIRSYLRCQVAQDRPQPELEQQVSQALRRNPYPAATREDLHAWFFDTSLLKAMPARPAELAQAIDRLEDQALARTAMGDPDLARAARARADRMRQLVRVLDELGGG